MRRCVLSRKRSVERLSCEEMQGKVILGDGEANLKGLGRIMWTGTRIERGSLLAAFLCFML